MHIRPKTIPLLPLRRAYSSSLVFFLSASVNESIMLCCRVWTTCILDEETRSCCQNKPVCVFRKHVSNYDNQCHALVATSYWIGNQEAVSVHKTWKPPFLSVPGCSLHPVNNRNHQQYLFYRESSVLGFNHLLPSSSSFGSPNWIINNGI